MTSVPPTALIIEPNSRLVTPYSDLPPAYSILRVSATEQAHQLLQTVTPAVVLISTSYSMTKTLELLDQIKQLSVKEIIPVIFVVDWANKMSLIPGTTWGGKVGLLHGLSSKAEIAAAFKRVLKG